jgi:predicted NUDIX family NTP pyrophosphohydrolase
VLLVHPGGPLWTGKDLGAWSIPKGEFSGAEDALSAALRECAEELGEAPAIVGKPIRLAPVRQAGGKTVHAWAVRSDFDPARLASNTFTMEWPPRSGHMQTFPEVDRASWFTLDEARRRILEGQVGLVDELETRVASSEDLPA